MYELSQIHSSDENGRNRNNSFLEVGRLSILRFLDINYTDYHGFMWCLNQKPSYYDENSVNRVCFLIPYSDSQMRF